MCPMLTQLLSCHAGEPFMGVFTFWHLAGVVSTLPSRVRILHNSFLTWINRGHIRPFVHQLDRVTA